jgi:hypothetical protein
VPRRRDSAGATLDDGKTYKLSVPQPVPGKLFWSVTVYDTDTRSQVQTDQGNAALRSLFELKGKGGSSPLDLYFGPTAPAGHEPSGSRPSRAKDGLGISASTARSNLPSMVAKKPVDFEETK